MNSRDLRDRRSFSRRIITAASLLAAFVVLAFAALYNGLVVTRYLITDEGAPEGLRIVHISDLHCARFGEGQLTLVKRIAAEKPDIIVLTGDIFDQQNTDTAAVRELLEGLSPLGVPIYSVSGNHEKWYEQPACIREIYDRYGVVRLENRYVDFGFDGTPVRLCGIADPDMWSETLEDSALLRPGFAGAPPSETVYSILLFHRANLFPELAGQGYNLILSGHIHGGQVRIPFFGGVASPYGNFWPEYDAGRFERDGTSMVVSRGLGNSIRFPRVFNPPEICVIEFSR